MDDIKAAIIYLLRVRVGFRPQVQTQQEDDPEDKEEPKDAGSNKPAKGDYSGKLGAEGDDDDQPLLSRHVIPSTSPSITPRTTYRIKRFQLCGHNH